MVSRWSWFPFYPGDWKKEECLVMASLEEKGMWVELMCAMWISAEPGYLRMPPGVSESVYVARLVGIHHRRAKKLLDSLESKGVWSRTEDGVMFSRRLVKIVEKLEATRQKLIAAGKRGAKRRYGRGKADADVADVPESAIPADLRGLQLYETDGRLCKAWHKLEKALVQACPSIDVMTEVRRAHAWEVANPSRRKKLRTRFLQNWCARAQDQPRTSGKGAGEPWDIGVEAYPSPPTSEGADNE